jgi:hypothetical protein
MPEPPPVTMATLSFNLIEKISASSRKFHPQSHRGAFDRTR